MNFRKTKLLVADHERFLHYKDRVLVDVLEPGKHMFWDVFNETEQEVLSITNGEFKHPNLKVLVKCEPLNKHLVMAKTNDAQAALIYKDGKLDAILGPDDQRYFWKASADYQITLVDLNEHVRIDESLLREIIHQKLDGLVPNTKRVLHAVIPEEHVGLRFEDGQLVETLKPGRYGFWALNRALHIEQVDLRLKTEEIAGQEILTKDRVSIRLNLNAMLKVTDATTFTTKVKKGDEHIYRVLQLALREAVGTKTLDALLENKQAISATVLEQASIKLKDIGVTLKDVGVKDIILPGEMKDILNQVVEAQKAAEANGIKRREETSATRSLHNTAKLMENNPVLMRLKELETLEKVAERIEKIQVVGGLDQVLNMSKLLT